MTEEAEVVRPEVVRIPEPTTALVPTFASPMPPPDILRGYEEICPGISGKILHSVLEEAAERRRINALALQHSQEMGRIALEAERDAAQAERRLFQRGQVFALVTSVLGIVGMFVLIALEPSAMVTTVLAGLFGLGGIGAIIRSFLRPENEPAALPKPSDPKDPKDAK